MKGRLLESLRGIGEIHAGGRLLRTTRYELSLWAPDEAAPSGDTPETEPRVDGHIDITGMAESVVLAGPEHLVLTLEDGRRLQIQLTSSGGSIAGYGWLPRG